MAPQTDASVDWIVEQAILDAKKLIDSAEKQRTFGERLGRKRVARLFSDEKSMRATITLTDEVMRIDSARAAAKLLRRAARLSSIRGFGLINSLGIKFLSLVSLFLPTFAVGIVHVKVRLNSKNLILDSSPHKLSRHIAQRQKEGIKLNINVLGEAVLGEEEAEKRFQAIVEMIRRQDVKYLSVKLSSIVSQIQIFDDIGSSLRLTAKLRQLYRESNANDVFINLDMEEFRDLDLTLSVFITVLSEPEFLTTSAGIVLQAYLPEAHQAIEKLLTWSRARFSETGTQIKIRIVKGANLAMETTEAELHGWRAAPYGSKREVDASYLRLLDLALRPEFSTSTRIGVASHNLLHLAWAIRLAHARGVVEQIDIEMLEGMANGEARALVDAGNPVLLYVPVTTYEDFPSAVAYLVRRLDENTSTENYLRAAFEIDRKPEVLANQVSRFREAVRERHVISTLSLRQGSFSSPHNLDFMNSTEIDLTDSTVRSEIFSAIRKILQSEKIEVPMVIGGKEIFEGKKVDGGDPSSQNSTWYCYTVGNQLAVDKAIETAFQAGTKWAESTDEERAGILRRAASVIQSRSSLILSVMSRDAGKIINESIPEISEAIDFANYYASLAQDFGNSQPLGTVLVVPPWNFPFAIPFGGVCAALAAGNAVILKPSPDSVATAYEVAQCLWSAGVPREVFQFLPMKDDHDGQYLVSHKGIDGVILTGSIETAKLFTSWRKEINLLAETSGKNSILISSCSDIDLAVRDLVQSAFGHAGQKCSAASIAIVEKSIYRNPAFFRQLVDAVSSLSVGPSWVASTTLGPLIRVPEEKLHRALNFLDEGESWLLKPEPIDESQLLWRPGIRIGVRPGSWSHQQEWFGPVLGIIEAPDFETALKWQNQNDFGLTAGLQTLDEVECEKWIENVEAGNIYINRGITGAIVNRQPFGGWKSSAVGPQAKAGGRNYLNVLRRWPQVSEGQSCKYGIDRWFSEIGSQSIDYSKLASERNCHRYRKNIKPILVVVDQNTSSLEKEVIHHIINRFGIAVEITNVETFFTNKISSISSYSRVRWLASLQAPTDELLARGISVDFRPIAQRGDIEGPRWLLEQSVTITFHRYGNTNAGPKPEVPGLISLTRD